MSRLPVRVVVADDEPHALDGMVDLISQDPEIVVCATCDDGVEAVKAIRLHKPDIVMLDIQMPGLDGFGVLREIGLDKMPTVVFVTAYDEFALRAFEVHAVEYLLKPFSDQRFREGLAHAKEQARGRALQSLSSQLKTLLDATDVSTSTTAATDSERSTLASPVGEHAVGLSMNDAARQQQHIQRLTLRHDGSVIVVSASEVEWIEAADYYSRVHARKRAFMVRETLAMFEAKLDPAKFFRTHRSAIVNLDCVREVQSMFHGESVAILQNGARVRVAKPKRALLERALRGGGS